MWGTAVWCSSNAFAREFGACRIRCSIRIWQRPHVKVGGRYQMNGGQIVVDSIAPITVRDITQDLARESGFESVDDLLRIAKHGSGDKVYLIRFPVAAGGRLGHVKAETSPEAG